MPSIFLRSIILGGATTSTTHSLTAPAMVIPGRQQQTLGRLTNFREQSRERTRLKNSSRMQGLVPRQAYCQAPLQLPKKLSIPLTDCPNAKLAEENRRSRKLALFLR